MKKWKKIAKRLGYGVLGLCALSAAAWFVPFPIEGNWLGGGGCGCEHHSFMRFEDGKILFMAGHFSPFEWCGTYQRTGWGKYAINMFYDNERPHANTRSSSFIRSTFIRTKSNEKLFQNLTRDPFVLTCRKIVNDPENDWVVSHQGYSFRIMGTVEERLFTSGNKEIKRGQLSTNLSSRLYPPPLPIYTTSHEAPSCVIDIVVQNGFDYHVHSNQHWIETEWVDDPSLPSWKRNRPLNTEDANPLWTNMAYQVIIRKPPDEDQEEDPKICFYSGEMKRLSDFKIMIENRRRIKETLKNHLYLYVKDGILPEDVRQMLEPFDLNYHVRDERILYRGK